MPTKSRVPEPHRIPPQRVPKYLWALFLALIRAKILKDEFDKSHRWFDRLANTGIYTYLWIVTNRKEKHSRGKIQLVDATSFFKKMRKSLGNKRNEIGE